MATIRKSELKKMSHTEISKKIMELEKSLLELRAEGRVEKTKSIRKTIARLKTLMSMGNNN